MNSVQVELDVKSVLNRAVSSENGVIDYISVLLLGEKFIRPFVAIEDGELRAVILLVGECVLCLRPAGLADSGLFLGGCSARIGLLAGLPRGTTGSSGNERRQDER